MSHAPKASPKETQHDPFANQLSRLKKQSHKEWEEEFLRKNAHYDYKKANEGMLTKLDTMRQRWIEGMTPRTRALFEAFDQAEAEDDEAKQARWRLPAPVRGQAVAAPHPAEPADQSEDDQMSTRELPDFLKQGDPALQAPLRRSPVHLIGKGFPEMKPPPEGECGDVLNLREEAARGWLKAVELGLIGG